MTWDLRWRLHHRFDRVRFEEAVRAAVAPHQLEVKLDGATAHVKVSRELALEHHVPGLESLPDGAWFWGTIHVHEYTLHEHAEDGPFEVLHHDLADAEGSAIGAVTSLCSHGGGALAASSTEHTFHFDGRTWDELDWPEDYDDALPRCVASDGANAWAAGDMCAFEVRRTGLVPVAPPSWPVRFIGVGPDGRCVATGPDGFVEILDGGAWRTLQGELGGVAGLASGSDGVYVSASLALLAKLDAHRVIPIHAPAEIAEVFWETPAIAVAADGAVWLAQDGRATRFHRGEWTAVPCPVDNPFAIVPVADALYVLGANGTAASWTGLAWEPFRFAAPGNLYCACASPERGVFVGGDSTIYSLERRGPVATLSIDSGTSANRECWGAICVIGQAVATALGAGPPR